MKRYADLCLVLYVCMVTQEMYAKEMGTASPVVTPSAEETKGDGVSFPVAPTTPVMPTVPGHPIQVQAGATQEQRQAEPALA
jgi:hypothetical protein